MPVALVVCLVLGAPLGARAATAIDFDRQVKPIFTKHCLACHGGVKAGGGLSFVFRETALAEGESGLAAIAPGDVAGSYLLDRVSDPSDETRMPPPEHGPRLSDDDVATLRRWVEEGAPWGSGWAMKPPMASIAPKVARDGWARTEVDPFVLARLEAEGLAPAQEADRLVWLRRVSLDLVGLPPTEAERVALLTDTAPGAADRVVDRLLASEHFGERWATPWLDLARYADTMGFERDPARNAWPYRDWVVRALSSDVPFDAFLVKQLAGDLLPGATLDDRLATTFHRNSQTNTEGGTDDEEFRLAAVIDRVDSTWKGLGATTFGCARCHDHPYEPITQVDYYRFLAVFNQTADADLSEEFPKLAVPTDPAEFAAAQRLDDESSALKQTRHAAVCELTGDENQWRPLGFTAARSTEFTRLVRRGDPAPVSVRANQDEAGEATTEIVAEGTVVDRSRYTLRVAPGELADKPLTAFRFTAMPKDVAKARTNPEMGFVVSRLRVFVERAGAAEAPPVAQTEASDVDQVKGSDHSESESKPQTTPAAPEEEVFFSAAFADEAEPFFDPEESLRDTVDGWGVYSRLDRPRWGVFTLDKPVTLAAGDRLRVDVKQEKTTDGQGAVVFYRLRIDASADPSWPSLVAGEPFQRRRERLAEIAAERGKIASVSVPVMTERPAPLARDTFVHTRGAWLSPGDYVEPGVPRAWPQLPAGTPVDRLSVARWIASPEHPQTSRVLVNRVWSELFGAGLVETLDDFGATGGTPSHPELLDTLAVRFANDYDWSLKRLLREIVLSATYRQDSRGSAASLANDPTNRLLARGPRTRLSAEMVRDQALVLSGHWNPQRFGPPVMPHQPDGIWRSAYSGEVWKTATDSQRFRRAVYTYWKRTSAYPSMLAFDATPRETCVVARPKTNTPLQALVTMNDPAYMELAERLGERIAQRGGAGLAERIAWGVEEATGLPPAEGVVAELVSLHAAALAAAPVAKPSTEDKPSIDARAAAAEGAETPATPDAPTSEGACPTADAPSAPATPDRFAMTIVASAILNLDATLSK
ncbi:MAG: PSD1 and planctomycete cytochrome C domain-containing protein [Lacipirellulaceae bacterium]